jgi:hypothetical protein
MAVLQFSNIALKVVKLGLLTKISVYLFANVAIYLKRYLEYLPIKNII